MDLNGPWKWCAVSLSILPFVSHLTSGAWGLPFLSSYLSFVSNFHFIFSSTAGLPSW